MNGDPAPMRLSGSSPLARVAQSRAGAFLAWVLAALAFRTLVAIGGAAALERAEAAGFAEDGTAYYLPLARSLSEGRGFLNSQGAPTAFHMPGYPLLLAAARWVTPSWPAAILSVQVLCGSLIVGLVFLLSASLFSRRAGHASAAIALLWPDLVIYSFLNLSDTPFLCAALACAWIHSRQLRNGTAWLALLLGVGCGVGTLVRESMISFAGAWMIGMLVLPKGLPPIRRGLNLLLVIAATALILLPWWIRNTAVFGEFIPLTTKGARNIYVGTLVRTFNFSDARSETVALDDAERRREEEVDARVNQATTARDKDRLLLAAAFENVRREPLTQLRHLGRKTWFLWQPNIGPRHADRIGMAPVLWLLAVAHWALVILGCAALWILRREPRTVFTLIVPFVLVLLFHVVVGIGEPRYHLPLLPFLIVALPPALFRILGREASA